MIHNISRLQDIRYWIFDMDGTLTVAKHDFAMIRKVLEVADDEDILDNLAKLPEADRLARERWLAEYELKVEQATKASQGSSDLLDYLAERSTHFAILTRNLHALTEITLTAANIAHHFPPELIIGRDTATPKPSPDGIIALLTQWQIAPEEALIIGDHEYDLAAGKSAGIITVLINQRENIYPKLADYYFPDCLTLLNALRA